MYLQALQQEDCQGSQSYGVPMGEGREKGKRKERKSTLSHQPLGQLLSSKPQAKNEEPTSTDWFS